MRTETDIYLDWSLRPDHRLELGPERLDEHHQHRADDDSLEETFDVGQSPVWLVVLRLHLPCLYHFIKSYETRLFMNWFTWFLFFLFQALLTTNIFLFLRNCIFNSFINVSGLFSLVNLVLHGPVDYWTLFLAESGGGGSRAPGGHHNQLRR